MTYIVFFYALYKAAKLKYLFKREANKKTINLNHSLADPFSMQQGNNTG